MKSRTKYIIDNIALQSIWIIVYGGCFAATLINDDGYSLMGLCFFGALFHFCIQVNEICKLESYLNYLKKYKENKTRKSILKAEIEKELQN